jgi:hypothetical protein
LWGKQRRRGSLNTRKEREQKMSIKQVSIELIGIRPLLMHSAAGADPLSTWAKLRKPLSSKRVKTDEDHAELAKLDWYSGFYADKDKRPVILSEMLDSAIFEGAKITKQGRLAKAKVMFIENPVIKHDHPSGAKATIDDFWADERFRDARGVKVNNSRIIRYRPIFQSWSVTAIAQLTDIDVSDFKGFAERAGHMIGIGDYRPKYGLFEVGNVKTL